MSSFRIDRQYVSFVTAETRCIYPAGLLQDSEKILSDNVEHNEDTGEAEKRCAKAQEKARKEAEEEAAHILQAAKSEADIIISEAKKLTDKMMEEARANAIAVNQEAKNAGYSEGEKRAQQLAEEKKRQKEKEFNKLTEQLQSDYDHLVDSMREDVITLVIDIVKKIINFRLNESDEIFFGLVENALGQLKENGAATIHVGTEDYARYFGGEDKKETLVAGKEKITVSEEAEYLPGDLVVESDGEILDFSIGKQIERVKEAFLRGEN